ncbi:MAG: DUF748 domain-containing protein [Desulforhopalus sp.]
MKQIQVKRWMKICGGVVVFIVLLFLLFPVGAKYYLVDWLEKNGADSATIQNLRYNPFAGKIFMGGMDVEKGGESILHNASMVVDFGLASLFNRDIRVQKAVYRDLSINLEQYKDGRWRFGSYTMQSDSTEDKVVTGENVASAWNFLADHVVLNNCSVKLKTPDLEMVLLAEEAELTRLSTRAGQPAGTFTFKGQLNGGPIALQLDTVQLAPALRLGGKIVISRFQLDALSQLLDDILPTLAGEISLDGRVLFNQEAQRTVLVEYEGTVDLNETDMGNSNFNTTVESLSWKGTGHYDAPANGPARIETDGLVAIRNFTLQVPASELVTEESRIELNGKTSVTISDSIVIKNDGSLLLEGVELVLPPYGVAEENFAWEGTIQYDSDYKQEGFFVRADGSLDLGEFQVGGGEQSASFATGGKMASWQGMVELFEKGSGTQPVIELDGTLIGGELLTTLAEPPLRLGQEKVELKIDSTVKLGDKIDIRGLSALTLVNFSLFEGGNNKPVVSFNQFAADRIEGRRGMNLAIDDIVTTDLTSSLSGDFPLDIDISEIKLSNLSIDDLKRFTIGEFHLQKPLITAVKNGEELVRLDTLSVHTISFDEGGKAGAKNVRMQNFVFLGEQGDGDRKPAVSFREATLKESGWSLEAGFQGDILQFEDLITTIVRDKEGNVNITEQLAEMRQQQSRQMLDSDDASPANTADSEGPAAVPLRLQKIVVAGNSAVFFEDYTLAVPYLTDLAISRLEVTGLDSGQPDQKTEILLQGELEKRAPLEIAGHISPFKEKTDLDMNLKLKNYPLSSLSAYTAQSVGMELASGQLQLTSVIDLANDNLNMMNDILLKKLETRTISPKLAAELNNELPIPLDAALSMLRDSDRNISLDVPLSGPVSELNVGVSDILITALGKAIVPAASGYLMYALGPYGALAYVGMKVGEKMLQVELPPVVFAQQEATLTKEHVGYLERIAKILEDRPETDMQLCPKVASWEFMTEQEKAAAKGDIIPVDKENRTRLLELGQNRAVAVQGFLASGYGIDRGRLLVCKTSIETDRYAVPAVILEF